MDPLDHIVDRVKDLTEQNILLRLSRFFLKASETASMPPADESTSFKMAALMCRRLAEGDAAAWQVLDKLKETD